MKQFRINFSYQLASDPWATRPHCAWSIVKAADRLEALSLVREAAGAKGWVLFTSLGGDPFYYHPPQNPYWTQLEVN